VKAGLDTLLNQQINQPAIAPGSEVKTVDKGVITTGKKPPPKTP
jgi:hypothetical protein